VRGAFRSSIMIVMMTAMTPSENASTRALENEPSELDVGSLPQRTRPPSRRRSKGVEKAERGTAVGLDSLIHRSRVASQRLSRVRELDCKLPRRDFAPLHVNPPAMSHTVWSRQSRVLAPVTTSTSSSARKSTGEARERQKKYGDADSVAREA
jgi:hypothetical protein